MSNRKPGKKKPKKTQNKKNNNGSKTPNHPPAPAAQRNGGKPPDPPIKKATGASDEEPNKSGLKLSKRRNFLKVIGSICLAVITVIGTITWFWPSVSVSISDPVDPNNPFSAKATITNTGHITLRNVEPFIDLGEIKFGDPQHPGIWKSDVGFTEFGNRAWHAADLSPNQPLDIGLSEGMFSPPSLLSADLRITVKYQLPIIPIHREYSLPFSAAKQSNGHFYWYYTNSGMKRTGNMAPGLPTTAPH